LIDHFRILDIGLTEGFASYAIMHISITPVIVLIFEKNIYIRVTNRDPHRVGQNGE